MRGIGLRIAVAATALVCAVASASAQRRDPAEDVIKAAFLFNFTKFVDWPDRAFMNSSAPFTVCVSADEAFRRALEDTLTDERVRGRQIQVVRRSDSDDLTACHVAYFGRPESEGSGRRLTSLRQAPVLTVGEGRQFLQQGGLIAFVLESDRVRFAISKRSADAAGLTISSKLLRLARPFDGAPAP